MSQEKESSIYGIDFSDGDIISMLRDLPDACCIFRVVTDPFGTVRDMQFLFVNEKYASLVGKSSAELVGTNFYDSVSNRDEDWIRLSYQAAIMRQSVINRTFNTQYGKWFEFWAVPVYKKGFCSFIIHDVTAEKRKEENRTIKSNSNRLIIECAKCLTSSNFKAGIKLVLEQLGQALVADRVFVVECTDSRKVGEFYSWANKNTGMGLPSEKEFEKYDFFSMWDMQMGDESIAIVEDTKVIREQDESMYQSILEGNINRFIVASLTERGRVIGYMIADNFNLAADFDINNVFETVSLLVGSELCNYRLTREMTYLSRHDVLTGLGNRYSLAVTQEMLSPMNVAVGICYSDINGLKEINDKNGHQYGDTIIREAGLVFASVFKSKYCYRVGGDEFVAIVPHIEKDQFEEMVESFKEKLKEQGDRLTMAVGSVWIENSMGMEEALKQADLSMYNQKSEYYSKNERRKERIS